MAEDLAKCEMEQPIKSQMQMKRGSCILYTVYILLDGGSFVEKKAVPPAPILCAPNLGVPNALLCWIFFFFCILPLKRLRAFSGHAVFTL